MTIGPQEHYRGELAARRVRLEEAAAAAPHAEEVARLLGEVDAALRRLDEGRFGLCLTCGDPIEPERLAADPLARFCLDHLSTKEQRDLEADLELARRIQRGFLPLGTRRVNGWRFETRYAPAGVVGGDYCDVAAVEDGTGVWFVVGDISGKGVAGSLLMSHLHAIFRSLLTAGLPIAALAQRANRLLCQHTLPASYATVLCGMAQPDGTVELVCAGHCAPVLVSGGEARLVTASGLPMGLFCDTRYTAEAVRLRPGDELLLYTDGVPEAVNRFGEEFGVERLLAVCRGAAGGDLTEAVMREVERFREDMPPADDVTVFQARLQ
ncbi:MAG: SpoIIE family protein phosphatase [Bryobacteraceae bacterium]|nr:SpoIIE family protein phosphatase [Bryobacteraceae bacterium]